MKPDRSDVPGVPPTTSRVPEDNAAVRAGGMSVLLEHRWTHVALLTLAQMETSLTTRDTLCQRESEKTPPEPSSNKTESNHVTSSFPDVNASVHLVDSERRTPSAKMVRKLNDTFSADASPSLNVIDVVPSNPNVVSSMQVSPANPAAHVHVKL